ncbi:hypothetical protein RF11_05865 [Thelohanellus kitauei]|uniref:Uncharacterized protein n=1 Tax=Thelohanellus kitauei TaxID=669202 RepID=A0A0C2IWA4_THEKT|nr:hypothetical protein RF11_05865 [Thelohanellus kitauei]
MSFNFNETESHWRDKNTNQFLKWSKHIVIKLTEKDSSNIEYVFENVDSVQNFILSRKWNEKYNFIDMQVYRTEKGGLMRQINQSKYKDKAGYRRPMIAINSQTKEKIHDVSVEDIGNYVISAHHIDIKNKRVISCDVEKNQQQKRIIENLGTEEYVMSRIRRTFFDEFVSILFFKITRETDLQRNAKLLTVARAKSEYIEENQQDIVFYVTSNGPS